MFRRKVVKNAQEREEKQKELREKELRDEEKLGEEQKENVENRVEEGDAVKGEIYNLIYNIYIYEHQKQTKSRFML